MATLEQLRESTADGTLPAYAWPGGYPMHYFTRDGAIICPKCANDPNPNGIDPEMISDPVIAGDVYWEGPVIYCEDQSEPIESAYGDPDEDPDEPEPPTAPASEPYSVMMAAFRPFRCPAPAGLQLADRRTASRGRADMEPPEPPLRLVDPAVTGPPERRSRDRSITYGRTETGDRDSGNDHPIP